MLKSIATCFRFSVISFIFMLFAATSVTAQTFETQVLNPPRNFEIALGNSVTPSVRVINITTSPIAGIKLYYRIESAITGAIVYFDSVTTPTIDSGGSVDESFPPYVTSFNNLSQRGTFNGCMIAASDTECDLLFAPLETALPFFDPSDNYSKTVPNSLASTSVDLPDPTLWTSEGATVVDGEDSTWDPPPPRYPGIGAGPDAMVGPVIRLDRLDYNGNFYSANVAGDTLTSVPINLQGQTVVNLSFDYARAGRHHYPLGWDADTLFGPESTTTNVNDGSIVRVGDSLVLEFLSPSQPALNPASNGWNEIAGIDGGRDFEFKSFFAQGDSDTWNISINGVKKTLTKTPNYLTSNFRFRLRLKAKSDLPRSTASYDDADQWYVDNSRMEIPNLPSVEMNWVRIVNPYSKVPISQAVFPVFVHVVTNDLSGFAPQPILVQIVDPSGDTIYSQTISLNFSGVSADTVLQFPNWDVTNESANIGAAFTAIASVSANWSVPSELDKTYSKFYLNAASESDVQEFAMDDAGLNPAPSVGNGIPTITAIRGSGAGFTNASGSFAMKFQLVRPDTFYGARAYFASENAAPDRIRISLLNGNANSTVPLDTVEGVQSTIEESRGPDLDQFSTYFYPQPIPLQAGTYWIAISQLNASASMELGSSIGRGGAEITQTDPSLISPDMSAIYGPASSKYPWYGTQWGPGPDDNNGDVSTSWAIEATAGSGAWMPILPSTGWGAEMNCFCTSALAQTLQPQLNVPNNQLNDAGIYEPMIRPIVGQNPLSIVEHSPQTPALMLESSFPNPFDPTTISTSIEFSVPSDGATSLTVYNVLGEEIRALVNENLNSGMHNVAWDGRNNNGQIIPAGAYLILLISNGQHTSEKIIVTE